MKCRRGGTCTPFIIGRAPTKSGRTFRICSRCAEVYVTDRIALGLPAQPGTARREPLDAEAEQFYREEVYA